MKELDKVIVGLLAAVGAFGVMLVLNEIATNPRINPLWRYMARTAEGDIYQHVISGEIVALLV